jgi:hypothetical protein
MFARAIVALIGLPLLMPAAPASAQTDSTAPQATPPSSNSPVRTVPTVPPLPESDDSRYTFHRVPDGYLRLDSKTGRVAMCSRRQVGWACQVLPDDRVTLESEIARLQVENGALKKALLSRDIPLPPGVSGPSATGGTNRSEARPQGESVLGQFMAVMAATWHRLVEVVAKIQRDISKDG